ncbi:MAG TPA: carbamoyl phosphate synthase small subunit, partial [Nitrolancea sp.]|nr:carbamoyl phosphate synthase small subunit [Nitrolancea sp.]
MPNADRFPGALILEDGRIFGGEPFGAPVDVEGEAVFTTTMTGYQEVATDPSFRGQIVCMTYPLIGNYGVMADDDQSRQPWIAGMIVREDCDEPSNWRSTGTFADYLARHGIPALRGVDTRALTRHLRLHGTMRALMVHDRQRWTAAELRERARSAWSPGDVDVVKDVTTIVQRNLQMDAPLHVVVIDCGVKERILQSLQQRGVRVSVVPYDSAPEEIL